ncbi:MAG TPA: translocation/assembly module TamB domain-containing protein, partial [Sphingobacteriaceae bacterium]
YNNVPIGDLDLEAGFDNSTKLVDLNVNIRKGGEETLDIQGTYNANINQQNLDLTVQMDNNEVIIFQPVLKNLVSDMTGKVSADLTVTGKAISPRVDGTISLNNAGVTVNYLKTHYTITDEFQVNNTIIRLDDVVLKDVRENEAIANGTVNMENPNVPVINVRVNARNFQALNTTAKDNPLYYGIAYGTGIFRFNGPTNNMRINIDAKTEQGTIFNIPLNAAETVGESEFITFVAKDSSLTAPKQSAFKGLTMNFDLQVDEKSEVNIITDLGRLSGRGNAALNMNITSFGDFEMFGDYRISQGRFDFTAQEVINKIFDIRQGGQIRFSGNPTEAVINLKAVYGVRTSVQPLYTAAGRTADDQQQRVLAEAVMNLSGPMLRPDITFDLNFPNDANIKDEVQSYLSDVSNLNLQASSLIVRRSFASGAGNMNLGEQTTNTLISAGTEFAFNSLNNILAQYLGLKYVDLNIRSLNEASASVRLLNDRLILTGGVTDTRTNVGELDILGGRVARDVEALYLLRRDGSLTIRASNRLNNRSFLNVKNTTQDEYVSAVGLIYRQEFDNLGEFLRLLIGKKRSEERQPLPTSGEPAPGIVEPRKPAQPVTRNSTQ